MADKEIKHVGVWHHRTEADHDYREKVFAEKWAKENELDSCQRPILSSLMNKKQTEFKQVTQRDATVAATVIQWLGSNVGNCFLRDCLKEIDRQKILNIRHQ